MSFYNYFALISISTFLCIFIGRTLVLYLHGVRVFVIGKGKGIVNAAMEIIFIIMMIIWFYIVFVLSCNLETTLMPFSMLKTLYSNHEIRIIGVILISTGMILFISALASFKKSWRIGIDTKNPDVLITNGVFSYTRNPIFLFLDMFFIGMALIYPNFFMTIFALVTVIGIHIQILHEEQFLIFHYKDEYLNYSKRVRRYI